MSYCGRASVCLRYTRQGTPLSLSFSVFVSCRGGKEATAATTAAAPEQRWHTVKAWRCIRYSTRGSSVCACYMFDMDLCGVILCYVCSFIHTPIVRTNRTSVHITLLCIFVFRSCSGPEKSINYTTKDTVYFVLLIAHKRTTNDQTQTATVTILRKARFRAVRNRTTGCHRPLGRRLSNILRHMNGEYGVGVWRVGARFQILCAQYRFRVWSVKCWFRPRVSEAWEDRVPRTCVRVTNVRMTQLLFCWSNGMSLKRTERGRIWICAVLCGDCTENGNTISCLFKSFNTHKNSTPTTKQDETASH